MISFLCIDVIIHNLSHLFKLTVMLICELPIQRGDFPRGVADKNPSASAGDMGPIPGPGRLHMPQSS